MEVSSPFAVHLLSFPKCYAPLNHDAVLRFISDVFLETRKFA